MMVKRLLMLLLVGQLGLVQAMDRKKSSSDDEKSVLDTLSGAADKFSGWFSGLTGSPKKPASEELAKQDAAKKAPEEKGQLGTATVAQPDEEDPFSLGDLPPLEDDDGTWGASDAHSGGTTAQVATLPTTPVAPSLDDLAASAKALAQEAERKAKETAEKQAQAAREADSLIADACEACLKDNAKQAYFEQVLKANIAISGKNLEEYYAELKELAASDYADKWFVAEEVFVKLNCMKAHQDRETRIQLARKAEEKALREAQDKARREEEEERKREEARIEEERRREQAERDAHAMREKEEAYRAILQACQEIVNPSDATSLWGLEDFEEIVTKTHEKTGLTIDNLYARLFDAFPDADFLSLGIVEVFAKLGARDAIRELEEHETKKAALETIFEMSRKVVDGKATAEQLDQVLRDNKEKTGLKIDAIYKALLEKPKAEYVPWFAQLRPIFTPHGLKAETAAEQAERIAAAPEIKKQKAMRALINARNAFLNDRDGMDVKKFGEILEARGKEAGLKNAELYKILRDDLAADMQAKFDILKPAFVLAEVPVPGPAETAAARQEKEDAYTAIKDAVAQADKDEDLYFVTADGKNDGFKEILDLHFAKSNLTYDDLYVRLKTDLPAVDMESSGLASRLLQLGAKTVAADRQTKVDKEKADAAALEAEKERLRKEKEEREAELERQKAEAARIKREAFESISLALQSFLNKNIDAAQFRDALDEHFDDADLKVEDLHAKLLMTVEPKLHAEFDKLRPAFEVRGLPELPKAITPDQAYIEIANANLDFLNDTINDAQFGVVLKKRAADTKLAIADLHKKLLEEINAAPHNAAKFVQVRSYFEELGLAKLPPVETEQEKAVKAIRADRDAYVALAAGDAKIAQALAKFGETLRANWTKARPDNNIEALYNDLRAEVLAANHAKFDHLRAAFESHGLAKLPPASNNNNNNGGGKTKSVLKRENVMWWLKRAVPTALAVGGAIAYFAYQYKHQAKGKIGAKAAPER